MCKNYVQTKKKQLDYINKKEENQFNVIILMNESLNLQKNRNTTIVSQEET